MRMWLMLALVLPLGFGLPAAAADPVLDWNTVALDAVATDHAGAFEQAGPGRTARALAMVHAAIYDAAFHAQRRAASPQLLHVAVSWAAHDMLAALYPSQRSALDLLLAGKLAAVESEQVRSRGIRIGARAARRVLRQRHNDGADAEVPWTPSPEPGHHREDPLHPGQGFLGAGWGAVEPFVLRRGDQLRPPPPPALDSAEYAVAYDEVKRLGGDGTATPTERTAAQTEIGTFWGYDGTPGLGTPPRLYNQIARVIAEQQGNDVHENARLFLLVNLALSDAGIACWEAKYHYDVWRPVLGIREAATGADPAWTPLGAPASNESGNDFTPPFPAYPSGHASFGAALFRILERFYGTDALAFSFVSDEMNGVTTDWAGVARPWTARSFASLDEAMWENALSRIYLGIHWRFDATEGVALGEAVADYVYDHALTPRGHRR
jgi:hypothetical protein